MHMSVRMSDLDALGSPPQPPAVTMAAPPPSARSSLDETRDRGTDDRSVDDRSYEGLARAGNGFVLDGSLDPKAVEEQALQAIPAMHCACACAHACMFTRMHACMHMHCMYARTHARTHARTYVCYPRCVRYVRMQAVRTWLPTSADAGMPIVNQPALPAHIPPPSPPPATPPPASEQAGLAEEPWPRSKLRPENPAAREAVLLSTGAMNPIHRGHIAMMHAAADRLRAAGYDIIR